MPDHYRCTVTCAPCGCRKHYDGESCHKQCLSAKLKSHNSQNGGQNGKGNSDNGKGKSKGRGKGQEQSKGGRGSSDKKNQKNQDKSGENPNATLGGTNPEPSDGQQNAGPTTCLKRRLKRSKNKEPTEAMKMGTSGVPANAPA